MMHKKHKILSSLLLFVVALVGLVPLISIAAPKVSATGEPYQYKSIGNCVGATTSCSSLEIVSTNGLDQLLAGIFNYDSGSTYSFTNQGGGGKITVTYADPGHGTLDVDGQKSAVTIGNTAAFSSYFPQDKSVDTSAQNITVKLTVDFGTTDPSLSIPSPSVSILGKQDLTPFTNSPTASPSTLSSPTVNFTALFQNQPQDTYHICAKADYITNSGNQVCTDAKKGAKALTVSLKANGDSSKLTAPINVAANQNACVSSNSLGWFLCKIYDGVGAASTWLFQSVVAPFLHEPPIHTDPSSASYQAWSAFRVYGDLFLVIALLVIVFGESIGGGLIDAYTAKKVLPRLLIAAVLINLSVYIVAALVDIANVLGAGIGDLLTKNIHGGGVQPINLNGTQSGEIGGLTAAGGIGVVLLAKLLGAKALASVLGSGLAYIGILLISMVFFGLLAMFITLLIRQAGILLLVLISPIAFALYCLPNTEQYFKKWWDLLLELLLVYPIVVAIFSAAQLLGSAIDSPDYSSANAARPIIAFILQFLPLFFIPFAFRLASKTIGRANEVLHGVAMRGHEKIGKGLGQQYKQNFSDKTLAQRERAYENLKSNASKGGFVRRKGLGFLAGQVGGYNMNARVSAVQAQRNKEMEDTILTGKDGEVRGLSVEKQRALNGLGAIWDKDLNSGAGGWKNARTGAQMSDYEVNNLADYRVDRNGGRQFQTLGGGWVNEAEVDRGWARWGHDKFAQQKSLSYEMRKANTDENRQRIIDNYDSLSLGQGGWGMTDEQAGSAWIGPAFENQNTSLQYKYVKRRTNPQTGQRETTFDHAGYVQEVYEKRGSYAMSNMDASSIARLTEAADLGTAPQEQLVAIANTMQDRLAAARSGASSLQPTGAEGAAEPTGAALGAGHVSEQMDRFVKKVLGG